MGSDRPTATQPKQFSETNVHGHRTLAGFDSVLTTDRKRRIKRAKKLTARPKNRLNDPLSYLHVLEAILQIDTANDPFSARDLVELLDIYKPMIRWDTVTVGRIVSDIAESLTLKLNDPATLAIQVIAKNHRSTYLLWSHLRARTVMEDLLSDLLNLCETHFEVPRQSNPLAYCPTVRFNA